MTSIVICSVCSLLRLFSGSAILGEFGTGAQSPFLQCLPADISACAGYKDFAHDSVPFDSLVMRFTLSACAQTIAWPPVVAVPSNPS